MKKIATISLAFAQYARAHAQMSPPLRINHTHSRKNPFMRGDAEEPAIPSPALWEERTCHTWPYVILLVIKPAMASVAAATPHAMPRTIGYHLVKSGYGLWLPGDTRGHWSSAWDEQIGFFEPHHLHAGDPVR